MNGSNDYTLISQIETDVVAIVQGVDASPYQQAGVGVDSWTEMQSLEVGNGVSSIDHLYFHVSIADCVSDGGHRGSPRGTERVSSALSVIFSYKLRPMRHAQDLRTAKDAAQAIAKAINRACPRDEWSPRFERISTRVDQEKGLALLEVVFVIVHTIEV